jgi:hypothetical protein
MFYLNVIISGKEVINGEFKVISRAGIVIINGFNDIMRQFSVIYGNCC